MIEVLYLTELGNVSSHRFHEANFFRERLQPHRLINFSEPPSHDPFSRSRAEIDVEETMAIFVCLAAKSGKWLVAHVINRDPRLHSVANMFINNLALTKIAMATIDVPLWIASLYARTWNLA